MTIYYIDPNCLYDYEEIMNNKSLLHESDSIYPYTPTDFAEAFNNGFISDEGYIIIEDNH